MTLVRRFASFGLFTLATLSVGWTPVFAQADVDADDAANYRLAARFAPYKLQDLIYSTSVSPSWIEGSESFWYEWENSDGSFYYIVDPVAGTKRQIFDNDTVIHQTAFVVTAITKNLLIDFLTEYLHTFTISSIIFFEHCY